MQHSEKVLDHFVTSATTMLARLRTQTVSARSQRKVRGDIKEDFTPAALDDGIIEDVAFKTSAAAGNRNQPDGYRDGKGQEP